MYYHIKAWMDSPSGAKVGFFTGDSFDTLESKRIVFPSKGQAEKIKKVLERQVDSSFHLTVVADKKNTRITSTRPGASKKKAPAKRKAPVKRKATTRRKKK